MTDKLPNSVWRRRARRAAWAVLALFAACAVVFLWMRGNDRHAWPAALPGLRLEPLPSAVPEGTSNAWDRLAQLAVGAPSTPQPIPPDRLTELRRFEALGLATDASYPALDAWLAEQTAALELWSEAARTAAAWAPTDDLAAHVPLMLRIVELSRLSTYRAALALRTDDWAAATEIWQDTLRIADHVTRGQGALGLFISLNATLSVCRDVILAASERDVPDTTARRLMDTLRQSELDIVPLAEALRHDRAMSHRALAALYTPRATNMPPDTARQHPPARALRIARWMGSTATVSADHLDAVCSHAIAAAERPYTPEGLFAGLPRWCRLERRAPWTRDPLGTLAATVFIRNVSAAAAYDPNRRAELRAARIALALNLARQADAARAWPATLTALTAFGLDTDALRDPFVANGDSFVYPSPGTHWTFYSVGLDQRDDGGTNDWFAATDPKAADIVYTSAERSRRAALWRAAPPQPPQRAPAGTP